MIGGSEWNIFIIIDTSALITLSDRNDKNHKRAVLYFKTSVKRGVLFVLGKRVVIEYIGGVVKRINKKKAIQELNSMIGQREIMVIKGG